jgi:choline dehydrogenase-like flavoprotein
MREREEDRRDAALQEAGPQVDQPKAVAGVVGARPVGWAAGVDARAVGCGAGGGVLSQRLARAGWSVVALDAGPFWDPDADWVSDEAGSHHLYWTEPRVIDGTDPVPLGSNNSGRGVGGSMVHFAGYTPRFHPSDFRTSTRDGVGADWPIAYEDLKRY